MLRFNIKPLKLGEAVEACQRWWPSTLASDPAAGAEAEQLVRSGFRLTATPASIFINYQVRGIK